jgi:Protein of unknown function (DUF3750)
MRPRVKLVSLILAGVFVLPLAARAGLYALDDHARSWREADWSSARLLPPAASDPPARVLVLAGRTGLWRGIFAVHTWIVVKPENAPAYTRYDLTGFGRPLHVNAWPVDGKWFGNTPGIVGDVRGSLAAAAIPKIEAAMAAYRYARLGDYRIWPGPNSNTFVATVLRAVPELDITLPPEAIGKDFRPDGFVGLTASRTGVEANLFGLIGLKLGWVEGIEVNVLSLIAGLDLRHPGVKLPGFGRIGVAAPSATAAVPQR